MIYNFIDKIHIIKDGLEPFPISIRGINWIKFISYHNIRDQKIDDSLLAQYYRLVDNLEYHLLGNHLLENGFSLLFAAYYFRNDNFYERAKSILVLELNRQVLKDGAHFELSPMYHQLMLYRILDSLNLVANNSFKNQDLRSFLEDRALLMMQWLNKITYSNGDIPLFNDSANSIAPSTLELNEYGKSLGLSLNYQDFEFKDCGYRKIDKKSYELILDVGNIGAEYIPGHAHADTFNFELHIGKRPFIVDTGTSTYDVNERRHLERSTQSHNTIVVNDENQSEVWGGFRVARRAEVQGLKEFKNSIEATHNGYSKFGVLHTRKFEYTEKKIRIVDVMSSTKKNKYQSFLHFHPDVNLKNGENYVSTEMADIFFKNALCLEIRDYQYSNEFNKIFLSKCVVVNFERELFTDIFIHN